MTVLAGKVRPACAKRPRRGKSHGKFTAKVARRRVEFAEIALLSARISTACYAEHDRFAVFGRGWTRRIAENLRYAARDLA